MASVTFSEDEVEFLVKYLIDLKKPQIQEFLADFDLPVSGTKTDLRERIEEAIDDDVISAADVVGRLDQVTPWGKQHVMLFKGPSGSIKKWKDPEWVENRLKQNRLGKYFNAATPLCMPDEMKISSIAHNGETLRVIAIQKREGWDRDAEYDDVTESDDGKEIELRAYVHRVMRSLIAFEWDLVSNNAMLQISQLPSRTRYEAVSDEFRDLVANWLDISDFSPLDLRRAIKALDQQQESAHPETRSHAINYRTGTGRQFAGRSASASTPLRGEASIDAAMSAVRRAGVGHLGNFYWLDSSSAPHNNNPLDREVHVIIVGSRQRVNFPTPNTEEIVRYVLGRIRSYSA